MEYNKVKITRGSGGWGGPITIEPTQTKNKIVCIAGGAIPEVAVTIAELTGCELIDGFKQAVKDSEIACVIINCGGTLRCGIYPQKRIPTVNIVATGKSGPLAKFIEENIYVSAVKSANVQVIK